MMPYIAHSILLLPEACNRALWVLGPALENGASDRFGPSPSRLLRVALLLCFLTTGSLASSAQNIQPTDSLFLDKIRTELQLPSALQDQIDSIYKMPIARLQQIDKEMNRLARTDIPQTEKDARFVELRAEKKALKEDRDLSILRLLTPEQQEIYSTKVVPAKPAVLHMGSNHDRASCTVCVKPQQ